jgi:hypothetical protein
MLFFARLFIIATASALLAGCWVPPEVENQLTTARVECVDFRDGQRFTVKAENFNIVRSSGYQIRIEAIDTDGYRRTLFFPSQHTRCIGLTEGHAAQPLELTE